MNKEEKTVFKLYEENHKRGNLLYKNPNGYDTIQFDNVDGINLDTFLCSIHKQPDDIIKEFEEGKGKQLEGYINELALLDLLKYYYNKCVDLEINLRLAEEKNISNSMVK